MGFANRGMTSSYDRQRGGVPGSGAGYGGDYQPGGLRSSSAQGPFSVAPYVSAAAAQQAGPMPDGGNIPTQRQQGGRFGAVDWAGNNPYTNGAIAAPKSASATDAGDIGSGFDGGMMAPGGGTKGLLNYIGASDHEASAPSAWDKMGDLEKANFYHDNPTMAAITQALQAGWSWTDLAKLQNELNPGFTNRQQRIAGGDWISGGGPSFGSVDLRHAFDGMGPGDIDALGVNTGSFGDYGMNDGDVGGGSDGYSRGYGGGGVW
jgi:hypothetical protein